MAKLNVLKNPLYLSIIALIIAVAAVVIAQNSAVDSACFQYNYNIDQTVFLLESLNDEFNENLIRVGHMGLFLEAYKTGQVGPVPIMDDIFIDRLLDPRSPITSDFRKQLNVIKLRYDNVNLQTIDDIDTLGIQINEAQATLEDFKKELKKSRRLC